jgi:uncharacterized membrane protein HdeD (DUF308 family)
MAVSPAASAKLTAAATIALGVSAIALPYLFGKATVMMLAAVMLASGVVALVHVNAARKQGIPVSVLEPWAQIVAGVVLFLWPEIALWLVAVVLGGGLVLSGVVGLSALASSPVVNPPLARKLALWSSIVLGVALIALGATGSALLLGVVLGVALIGIGIQQFLAAGR